MRIFPEGWEQTLEPCGKAMVIIAKIMLGLALLAFSWRAYEFATWQRTQGEIVEAHQISALGENGEPLVSAEYTVRYTVQGVPYTVTGSSGDRTNDTASMAKTIAQLPGTKQPILYNPRNPSQGFANGTVSFFLAAVVSGVLGVAFWLGGRFSIFLGRWMQQRELRLP